MTNQTVEPPNKPSPEGMKSAPYGPSERRRQRRGSGVLLLTSVLLIAAAFAVLLLSPDMLRQIVESFGGSKPQATISVAPPPSSGGPTAPGAPRAPGPSAPPAATSSAPAIDDTATAEARSLRAMLADVTGRLGEIERRTASGGEARSAELANRLNAVEARLAALIEQPVVTPAMLGDALIENRQSSQAAAQEAAQQAAQRAVQETQAAARDDLRKAIQTALSETSSSLADLERRTAGLEKSAAALAALGDLEKRVTGLEKMATAVAAIVDLEKRTAALEKAAAAMVAVPDLERRVAAVEKTTAPLAAQSRTALQGESLALGLLALRTALDRGTPYADVIGTLRVAAAPDDVLVAEVERLAPAAASGLPTLAMLRQRLSGLSRIEASPPAPTAAESIPGETAAARGFWAEIWHRLSSVVTVRRLDNTAAQPTNAAPSAAGPAFDRAAERLAADDLAGAIALLDDGARRSLAGAQSAALDDWLRDGRARLTAETAFANLSRRSLALYSAKPGAAAGSSPADASLQQ